MNENVNEAPDNNTEETSDNEDESEDTDTENSNEEESEEASNEENNQDSNSEEDGSNEEESENGEEENNNDEESSDNNDDGSSEDENTEEESSQEHYWGVDSASYTDEEHYSCIVDNFGEPSVFGRYIGENEGVSIGLDREEVNFLHDNDISILVIYNHVNDAVGNEQGVEHAEQAIAMAEDLSIPEDIALFVDIEPEYPIDSSFLQAWYETVNESNYYPAVYGVFDEGSELLEAYNAMESEALENMIVWTAYPQEGVTTKDNAPEYNPQGPDNSMLYGWQYGLESETCTIDTNLFTNDMMDYLWKE
ncbi:DUF1906 domain-containing protein [Oceanobacillus halophilus]|uniref:DUF1906 domain-containing protein n=2 Tax=Oceanobacillus halophilus TaxID=930130 RepID=A0A495A4Q4_9BACI|nr:DUF1906 domain-containing protein [Oceanobacillus halophilus]